MLDSKYEYLPQNLLEVGISLESIGIAELAWESKPALDVIEFLSGNGFHILGGDVYSYRENSVDSTYDSWYYNETNCNDSVENSKKRAMEYIVDYSNLNGDGYLYSIIFKK